MSVSTIINQEASETLAQVILQGDLSRLSSKDKITYYNKVCDSLGLNPFTKPFEYIKLQGKEMLYVRKDATEQLRRNYGISIEIKSRELVEDIYVVTAKARDKNGREDESIGAINIGGIKGDIRANAIMKAETKAKRRVTLSIVGLGFLDESELESVPDAVTVLDESLYYESISPAQIHDLRLKIEESGTDERDICGHLKIDSIEIMSLKDYKEVAKLLTKKIEKNKRANDLPINKILSSAKTKQVE